MKDGRHVPKPNMMQLSVNLEDPWYFATSVSDAMSVNIKGLGCGRILIFLITLNHAYVG
jgi:hypothetical protein